MAVEINMSNGFPKREEAEKAVRRLMACERGGGGAEAESEGDEHSRCSGHL